MIVSEVSHYLAIVNLTNRINYFNSVDKYKNYILSFSESQELSVLIIDIETYLQLKSHVDWLKKFNNKFFKGLK